MMISFAKFLGYRKQSLVSAYALDVALISMSVFYLVLPLLFFAFGWLKPAFAVIFSLLILWGSCQSLQSFEYREFHIHQRTIFIAIGALVLVTAWLLLSGIGGFGLQSEDFNARNAIFRDLINHDWPVRYDYANQLNMQSVYGQDAALVYYFLFWLPAALLGKTFGWQTANLFLFAWSLLGLLLVVYLIIRKVGKANLWIVVAFIFFSGMDILFAQTTNGGVSAITRSSMPDFLKTMMTAFLSTDAIEWWANSYFQYSSITTQLYNVFNQAIPAWMVTLLILVETRRKSHIFFYALLLPFAPLPFIGLLPLVVYRSLYSIKNLGICRAPLNLREKLSSNFFLSLIKENFSFQNIVIAGLVIMVSIGFLFPNNGSGKRDFGFIWEFVPQTGNLIIVYFLFCFVEFFILGLLLYKYSHERALLIFTLLLLFLIPIIKYGSWNEFSMRVSIPPLFLLFLLMAESVVHGFSQKANKRSGLLLKGLLFFVLLTGSITPIHEIHRSIDAVMTAKGSPAPRDTIVSYDDADTIEKARGAANFIVNTSGSPSFFQVFLK